MVRTRSTKRDKKTPKKYTYTKDPNTLFGAGVKKKKLKGKDIGSKEKPIDLSKVLARLGIDNMEPRDYITSDLDREDLVEVKPVALLKKMGGRGLFAKEFIPKGTCIGEYTGAVYPSAKSFRQHLKESGHDNSYAMELDGEIIDAFTEGGYTRYINASDSPSVVFEERRFRGKNRPHVIALRDIYPGEQLLVDYNKYNAEASERYFFLNPGDGSKSAAEVHAEHAELYQIASMTRSVPALGFKAWDSYYVTAVGLDIMNNYEIIGHLDSTLANLPCFRVSPEGVPMDFDEADAFTPLMLACYGGQVKNVSLLVAHQANVNQQQNHSGSCPLFLILEGYLASVRADKGDTTLAIIKILLANGANILAHDRMDRTFLHLAVSVLPIEYFEPLVRFIGEHVPIEPSELLGYIDQDNNDIITSCLKEKKMEHLACMLAFYPGYFKEHYMGSKKTINALNQKMFRGAIKEYQEDELSVLYNVIAKNAHPVSDALFTILEIDEPDDYSKDGSFMEF